MIVAATALTPMESTAYVSHARVPYLGVQQQGRHVN